MKGLKNWRSIKVEEYYGCPDCGNKSLVWRGEDRRRPTGHLKWLFCVKCVKDTNHVLLNNLKKQT